MTNYPQLNKEIQDNEIKVIMHTNKGDMTFKLFPEIAPKTVENFVTHAKNGYYDGITFHGSQFFVVQMKEVPDTMLNQLVDGGWPEPIAKAYAEKGGTPWLDQKHTVFGQLIDGETTLEDIANTKVGAQDKPVHDVVIESIDVEDKKA